MIAHYFANLLTLKQQLSSTRALIAVLLLSFLTAPVNAQDFLNSKAVIWHKENNKVLVNYLSSRQFLVVTKHQSPEPSQTLSLAQFKKQHPEFHKAWIRDSQKLIVLVQDLKSSLEAAEYEKHATVKAWIGKLVKECSTNPQADQASTQLDLEVKWPLARHFLLQAAAHSESEVFLAAVTRILSKLRQFREQDLIRRAQSQLNRMIALWKKPFQANGTTITSQPNQFTIVIVGRNLEYSAAIFLQSQIIVEQFKDGKKLKSKTFYSLESALKHAPELAQVVKADSDPMLQYWSQNH